MQCKAQRNLARSEPAAKQFNRKTDHVAKGQHDGRRLNRAAFDSPTGYAQGNLGRNALRGFGMSQLDLSLRRQMTLGEQRVLHLAVQAFNLLNTPSFANPSRNEGASMTSANFGVASRSQFGGGSLYQTGGPRSLQLSLRFQF